MMTNDGAQKDMYGDDDADWAGRHRRALLLRTHVYEGHWSVVQYLMEHDRDIGYVIRSADTPNTRRFRRMFFTDCNRWEPYHYQALVRIYHTVMGRRTAMDVQHIVVEMLVGKSIMTYFRSRAQTSRVPADV